MGKWMCTRCGNWGEDAGRFCGSCGAERSTRRSSAQVQAVVMNSPSSASQSGAFDVEMDPHLCFAMQQNAVPVIKALRVTNTTNEPLRAAQVIISSDPGFATTWRRDIDVLSPGETLEWDNLDLLPSASFLAQQNESSIGTLKFELHANTKLLASHSQRLDLLAYDYWPGSSSLPELLAAFVMPNHPTIESLLREAADCLRARGVSDSLDGYQRQSRKAVLEMLSGVYEALARKDISYANPPAQFESRGQKIRTPERVLSSSLATCIDIAVLFAACMEQAGLNAVLLVQKEHAFVGAWLDEASFQTPVLDDPLVVRKRVELDEMVVVEATALLGDRPSSFGQAIEEAKAKLAETEKFAFAVDVRRSRISGIRPIPGRIQANGTFAPVPEAPRKPREASAGALPTVHENISVESSDRLLSRIDVWKTKLLDLTLRNKLLNYKKSKKTLPILAPDPAALEDALADGKSFSLQGKPTDFDANDPRDAAVQRAQTGEDALEQLLLKQMKSGRLHVGVDDDELSKRALNIFRDAKVAMEESGTSALFLAIGFLKWFESETSDKPRLAPLLLVPIEITRKSAAEGFRIRLGGDETRFNTSLVEKLRADLQLEIPGIDPLPTDDSGVDVPLILRLVRSAVRDVKRWEVTDDVEVGFFSFTTYLMWKDLESRTAQFLEHRVVAHLVESRKETYTPSGPLPDTERLDQEYSAADMYCPLPVDSSQLTAVYAAASGRSHVLFGPPGTGKSQTITNMIAHAVGHGKTVLFVAEKKVALDVVHTRLVDAGLGDYCLELHSNKAKKSEVAAELSSSLLRSTPKAPQEWPRLTARLDQARAELNHYVERLHARRENGWSAFEAISKLTGLRSAPTVAFDPTFFKLDRAQLEQTLEVADQLRVQAEQVDPSAHRIWSFLTTSNWTPAWKDELERKLGTAQQAATALRASFVAWAQRAGLPGSDLPLERLALFRDIAKLVLDAPPQADRLLQVRDWSQAAEAMESWIETGQRRDQEREQLLQSFNDGIFSRSGTEELAKYRANQAKWALLRVIFMWLHRRSFAPALTAGRSLTNESLCSALELLVHYEKDAAQISAASAEAKKLLGSVWNQGTPSWDRVVYAKDWGDRAKQVLARTQMDLQLESDTLRAQWSTWVAAMSSSGDARKSSPSAAFIQAAAEFETARAELEKLLSDAPIHSREHFSQLADLEGWINEASQNVHQLRAWCAWNAAKSKARGAGLEPVVAALESRELAPAQVGDAILKSFLRGWLSVLFGQEPELATFSAAEQERKIERFRFLVDEHQKTAAAVVATEAEKKAPSTQGASSKSAPGILRYEGQKKRRHKPVRKLLEETGALALRLRPCFLMSPASVAQYLGSDFPKFDLVVFDEASQIPTWEAVGALTRGESTIVVGDPKQLPPTSFFSAARDDESLEEADLEDQESILDDCLSAGLPQLKLRWHYRSKHESLIAFSNHHYYDNKLFTFPSLAEKPEKGLGVTFHHVADGVYDKGKSRTNRAEAELVAAAVVERLQNPKVTNSIGVVTFSQAQQRLVEDLLEQRRQADPNVDALFDVEDDEDDVFVKNLENVQGDERDTILFSIGYGPDAEGRISMNFGPINKQGGHRRLNVAVTRARREVVVFSSMRAADIDLNRTRAEGVRDLKNFLEYAEKGTQALRAERHFDPLADFDSPFEEEVAERVKSMGFVVHPQVGCSGYRVDLGIIDPDAPGRYLLGIECDGATYHSAATARDRDKVRQAVLEGLGWRIHRIWSTDWWQDPDGQLAKALAAIEYAKANPKASTQSQPAVTLVAKRSEAPSALDNESESDEDDASPIRPSEPARRLGQPYQPVASQSYEHLKAEFYTHKAQASIAERVGAVIAAEAPILESLLARRVAVSFGMGRTSQKLTKRVRACLPTALVIKTSDIEPCYWSASKPPTSFDTFREPTDDPDSQRNAEEIPLVEVANAGKKVLELNIALPLEDFHREVAALFGFTRLGRKVRDRMQAAAERLAKQGAARIAGEQIELS